MAEPKRTFILCLDDSGTRHPDRNPGELPRHGNDWFALGGILFEERDEQRIKVLREEFCQRWEIQAPLHSNKIRSRKNAFAFLGGLDGKEEDRFYRELSSLLSEAPVYGTGCVVDRPCYRERYLDLYDASKRWLLCKSAFAIVVERTAKFVRKQNGRMRVFVERSDKKTDRIMRSHYEELKIEGMPFSKRTSQRYEPADNRLFDEVLFEFRTKDKSSASMQLADLYLWPIAMGGYDPSCRPYVYLRDNGKLIDSELTDQEMTEMAIKYYCFDR